MQAAHCSKMSASIDPAVYPLARKDKEIIDNFHGTQVADPYRWLETPDTEETKNFVDSLNAISTRFLESAPSRETMRKKLRELTDFPKYSCPNKRGGHYYYDYNSGLQNQNVLVQTKDLKDEGVPFFDPNAVNRNGTTSLRTAEFSRDGRIWGYSLSENGSDWATIRFKTAEGVDLDDKISHVKFCEISWTQANDGIFYSKYPDYNGTAEGTSSRKLEHHSLYFHRLGTDEKEDILLYQRPEPGHIIYGNVTEDSRFLIIRVSRGCDPSNLLYYYELTANPIINGKIEPSPLFDILEAKYTYVDHDEDSVMLLTTKDAPMFRVIRVPFKNPKKMVEIIPEKPRLKLRSVKPIQGGRLLVHYMEDGFVLAIHYSIQCFQSALYVYSSSGTELYKIQLPIGSVVRSFAKKSEPEEYRRVQLPGLDESQFQVEQVFFESKDHTKIPMFIISNAKMVKDGSNPTLLKGFNDASIPYFQVEMLLFIQHFGGVVAVANLRGGSEYGESWHAGGMREKKQNVFNDMLSAAEYLIQEKYTSPPKLAIMGTSNGGLLMAACFQQRPELFGAVINQVGVLDMLRFHKFTIGSAWIPEYGNPDDPADFPFLFKYSPLHRLKMPEGCQWPSTLLLTADHDDRVVPSHTLKYTATIYEKAKEHACQKNPLLAKIEVAAGHGPGKPTSKKIEEVVAIYTFLERVLGLTWKE